MVEIVVILYGNSKYKFEHVFKRLAVTVIGEISGLPEGPRGSIVIKLSTHHLMNASQLTITIVVTVVITVINSTTINTVANIINLVQK